MSRAGFDLLFFPTIYSFVPTLTRARRMVMIHDVIAETYPELTVPDPAARLFWNVKCALGRMQAHALLTVSEYSRRLIVKRFNIPADRVHVVGEAGDPVFRRIARPELSERLRGMGVPDEGRIVVYVGGFSPHKNLEALVRAFASLAARPEFHDLRLVMVGEHKREVFHSYFSQIKSAVDLLGIGSRTVFTGYLPDEELAVLLNRAAVLALPSLMEGFGLPAVEAAACGCPVVATVESPLPELLGDGGLFIEPHQGDLQGALRQVLQSAALRRRMSKAGLSASRALTWTAAARQMQDAIAKVAAE
jgi:glycosyltransferase involved in cell wall biosynthesis